VLKNPARSFAAPLFETQHHYNNGSYQADRP
jgi:hypothetical protein